MGHHLVDPDELDKWDDGPTDVRSHSVAAGDDYQGSKLGLRVYELSPGEQSGLRYHYHDEQVEAFCVFEGTLHVETRDDEYVVESDQALFVDPAASVQSRPRRHGRARPRHRGAFNRRRPHVRAG